MRNAREKATRIGDDLEIPLFIQWTRGIPFRTKYWYFDGLTSRVSRV